MKRTKLFIRICAAIFMVGIIGSILILKAPHGTKVDIVQDGNVLYSFDLSQTEDQTIEIVYEGRTNVVEIEGQQIRMMEAECPDHSCVKMGYLKSDALPIVCLPNHLVIKFASENAELDATVR